jgi:hypothetical protein
MESMKFSPEESEKPNKKKTPAWLRIALAAAVVTGAASVSGCESATPTEKYNQELEQTDKDSRNLTPEDVSNNPEGYLDEEIAVMGEVSDIEEDTRYIPMPYPVYNPATKMTELRINLSEETITKAKLTEVGGTDSIELIDTEGGAYLPLPITPAPESEIIPLEGEQTVIGTWEKSSEGKYYLRIIIIKPQVAEVKDNN